MSGPLLTTTASAAANNTANHNSLNSIGSKFLKLSGAAAPTSAALNAVQQQQQESQHSESPPQFRRMPSRRHQRRIVDGASHRKFPFFFFPTTFQGPQLHPLFISIPPPLFFSNPSQGYPSYTYNHVLVFPSNSIVFWFGLVVFRGACPSLSLCWFGQNWWYLFRIILVVFCLSTPSCCSILSW
jgi:hypothetical protein